MKIKTSKLYMEKERMKKIGKKNPVKSKKNINPIKHDSNHFPFILKKKRKNKIPFLNQFSASK